MSNGFLELCPVVKVTQLSALSTNLPPRVIIHYSATFCAFSMKAYETFPNENS